MLNILQQMVKTIEMAGIQVLKFHTKDIDYFKIALSSNDVMAAVDAFAHIYETIREVVVRNGLKATFAVKPTFSGASNAHNGSHVHLSLNTEPNVSAFLAYNHTASCVPRVAAVEGDRSGLDSKHDMTLDQEIALESLDPRTRTIEPRQINSRLMVSTSAVANKTA